MELEGFTLANAPDDSYDRASTGHLIMTVEDN